MAVGIFSIVYAVNANYALFDSANQSLTVADTVPLSITGDITIQLWANPTGAVGTKVLVAKYEAGQRSYTLNMTSTGKLEFGVSADSGASLQTTYDSASNMLNDGWHHYAAVSDTDASTMVFYVDGVATTTTIIGQDATSIYNGTACLAIGLRCDGANFDWEGGIDDVRIYASTRTAAQVAADYNCRLTDETGLTAHWNLDNSLLDETDNSADLTNNNSVTFPSTSLPYSADCVAGGGGAPARNKSFIINSGKGLIDNI